MRRAYFVAGPVLSVVMGLALFAGGAHLLWQQNTGPQATATVRSCDGSHRRGYVCRGSWTTGSLLAGGRVQLGIIEGATRADIGKTVAVRLHGERAHVPALRGPIICFVVGAGFLIGSRLPARE